MYSFCRQLLVSARNENKERLPDVANNGAARQKEGRNERIGVTTTDGGAAEGKEENNQTEREKLTGGKKGRKASLGDWQKDGNSRVPQGDKQTSLGLRKGREWADGGRNNRPKRKGSKQSIIQ